LKDCGTTENDSNRIPVSQYIFFYSETDKKRRCVIPTLGVR
jgi:hypothetical protein